MSTNRRGFLGRMLGLVAAPFAAIVPTVRKLSGSVFVTDELIKDSICLDDIHRFMSMRQEQPKEVVWTMNETAERWFRDRAAKSDCCRAYALRKLGPDHPDLPLVLRKIERRFGPAMEMAIV